MSLSFRNWVTPSVVATLVAVSAMHLNAEDRKYVVGTTVDVVGGGQSGQNFAGASNGRGSFFYEAYPSIQVRSIGAHSALDVSYAYGFSRVNSNSGYNSNSHGISAALTSSLGPKWKFTLSDSFQISSNFSTFYTTRGVASVPDTFVFNPVAYNTSTQSNNATVGAEYAVNEKATLSLSGSYSLLNYKNAASFSGVLSDQQRVSENITYSQKLTKRGGWRLSYMGAYSDFNGQFENAHTHAFNAGYFYQIGHDLTLQVTAGPSYVQTAGSSGNYSGYNAQVSVQKPIQSNTLSLYYTHETGQSTGLGSISDNDRAGASISRPIGKTTSFFADVSTFDVRGRLGNAYSSKGVSAGANMGMSLGRLWSLHWGGQYQHYDNASIFGFDQKRAYISLRFAAPELWKASR